MERSVILGMGKKLEIRPALNIPAELIITGTDSPSKACFLTFDKMAENHIRDALKLSGGKIDGKDGGASLLGLNVSTLRGKMRKYGITSSK